MDIVAIPILIEVAALIKMCRLRVCSSEITTRCDWNWAYDFLENPHR
jgi:hypothetical protein